MTKLFASAMIALPFLGIPALADVLEAIKGTDSVATCVEADPVAGHHFKPGCKETIQRAGFKSEMKYNAQGLRDRDYPPKATKGWTRILLVGSSKFAGPGLAEAETPPRRFEHYLRKVNKKIEVVNGGVEGYMPLNQAVKLRSWLEAYSPTHVLLQVELPSVLANDMMNAPYAVWENGQLRLERRVLGKMKPFAFLMGLDPAKYPDLRKIYTWQSAVWRAVHTNWCKLRNREAVPFTACLMQPTIRAIELMYKQATQAGARFQLLITPGTFPGDLLLSPAYDPDVARRLEAYTPRVTISSADFKKIMDKRAIPVAYGPAVPQKDNVLPGDYHFNALGADTYGRGLGVKLTGFLDLE